MKKITPSKSLRCVAESTQRTHKPMHCTYSVEPALRRALLPDDSRKPVELTSKANPPGHGFSFRRCTPSPQPRRSSVLRCATHEQRTSDSSYIIGTRISYHGYVLLSTSACILHSRVFPARNVYIVSIYNQGRFCYNTINIKMMFPTPRVHCIYQGGTTYGCYAQVRTDHPAQPG